MNYYRLASSYDPLYPLRGDKFISKDIFDLFQIDIYQFLISKFGKLKIFNYLEHKVKLLKHNLKPKFCLKDKKKLI